MNAQDYIGRKVIVRCNRAGVFYGTLREYDPATREATIENCRNLWYWDGAASLMQLSSEGVKAPDSCKFTVTVPVLSVMEVIQIIPCLEAAIKSIEEVRIWRR